MAQTENILKKGIANFTLIGRGKVNQYTFDIDKESDSGFIYNRMNFGVDCGEGNVVYGELMGGYNPEKGSILYVHGKDNDGKDDFKNRFQIAWEDRFDTSLLNMVGDNCFIKVGLETDVKGNTSTEKFLSAYDAIEYIKEHLEDGTVVNVKGNLEYSPYNDDVTMRKKITSVFLSKAQPEEFKARFTQTFFITPDSLSKKPNTEKNSLEVYGYVLDYVGKYDNREIKQTLAFPKMFEIDLNKYTNQAQLKQILDTFFKGKKGWYSELIVEGDLKEGATTVASSVADLTDELKSFVAMGLLTEEQAIAKTAVNGTREKRMIFDRPLITAKTDSDTGKTVTTIGSTIEKYKNAEFILASAVFESEATPEDEVPFDLDAKDTEVKVNLPTDVQVDGVEGGIDLNALFGN
jgi:hypothetical protein